MPKPPLPPVTAGNAPWWIGRVSELLASTHPVPSSVGELWRLSERLEFVRENIETPLLPADFVTFEGSRELWAAFEHREAQVAVELRSAVGMVCEQIRSGALGPVRFRAGWEGLGYTPHAEGGGTPADDYLDAITNVSRLMLGEALPPSGNVNMSSRAERIAQFLELAKPGTEDVVFDIGSGSGKLALTVAASTFAKVIGVEFGESYVAAARQASASFGLRNLELLHGDAREADLSVGTIFYLYHPFHGPVAQAIAQTLGRLARQKEITVFALGPVDGFAEHFLREVEAGAFRISERRGEYDQVVVLRSARS